MDATADTLAMAPEPATSVASTAGAAFFDFDGTLVRGDSLLPFLSELVGFRRARLSLLRAIHMAVQIHGIRRQLGHDIRTSVKAILLRQTVSGVTLAEARAAAERLAGWPRWNRTVRAELQRHHEAGRRIVVATGALSLYMPVLLRGLPIDDLLSTDLEVRDGVLTGHMEGGNCVRAMKAHRVSAFLREHGPFGTTWGYGNRPSDLPMLKLLDHGTVI